MVNVCKNADVSNFICVFLKLNNLFRRNARHFKSYLILSVEMCFVQGLKFHTIAQSNTKYRSVCQSCQIYAKCNKTRDKTDCIVDERLSECSVGLSDLYKFDKFSICILFIFLFKFTLYLRKERSFAFSSTKF